MCGTKICKECKEELPLNTDYFFKKKDTKDGYTTKCKKCQGYEYTDKLTKIPKDGYKFCIKCDRELKATFSYFPQDKTCKDGMRNVCRECGKDGHFMNEDYTPKRYWSEDTTKLFIERYPNYTNKELIDKFYPDYTEKALSDRAYILGIVKSEETNLRRYKEHSYFLKENSHWIGRVVSDVEKEKTSKRMKELWINNYDEMYSYVKEKTPETKQKLSDFRKDLGLWKGDKNPRHINPLYGSENGNWKGGITNLLIWLRNQLDVWKQESMKFHNYKCFLTGENFDEIHHLTSFKEIVYETLDELDIEYSKTLEQFTDEELETLRETIVKNNNKYGFGICLTKEVHKLFHDLYGYGDNTPEQFEEYIYRFNMGEFNEILKINNTYAS